MCEEVEDGVYKFRGPEDNYYSGTIAIIRRATGYAVYIQSKASCNLQNCNYSTGHDGLKAFTEMLKEGKWQKVTNISM